MCARNVTVDGGKKMAMSFIDDEKFGARVVQ